MPLPFVPPLAFAAGVVLAWVARRDLVLAEGALAPRPLVAAALYGGLVVTPVAAYFAAFHGDWAYLYVVPWRRVPSAVDLAMCVACGACVPGGLAAASALVRARRLRAAAWLAGAPLALVGIVAFALAGRVGTSATYAQYHGHFGGESLRSSPLGAGVALALVVLSLGFAACVRELRK